MADLDFVGRVAVVTGAGRGIGRAYAELLGALGACVVVNDLGGSIGGQGADAGPATEVAAAIVDRGGTAVADTSDVSSPAGASALIDLAIDTYGRVDALVNNAGIMRWASLPDVEAADFADHHAVHVAGSFHTTKAAWPHMVERNYGRIVMTTSAGLFGLAANTSYAAAKGGVVGLTRSAALAGAPCGIRVNAIAPAAVTRMAGTVEATSATDPALVAPMAAYLSHESCPVSGEVYSAGFGRFARLFVATTPGHVHHGSDTPSIDDVARHWDAINDEAGYSVPADLLAWSAAFTAHLGEG